MTEPTELERVLDKVVADPDITGVVVEVVGRDGVSWTGSRGDITPESPFFIASTTKLYTSSIVFRLEQAEALSLSDRVVDHVEGIERLHVIDDVDRTEDMTIRHLLSQTSGLPDYFQGEQADGTSLEKWLRAGNDRTWDLDYVIETSRTIGASFPPGQAGKALYSDTNYQLLGRVIESVTGAPYAAAVVDQVTKPLGLQHTWVYTDPADSRPVPLRDGPRPFLIPQAMTSFGPDGGVVATVGDLMAFLRAFFEGGLFPASRIAGSMEFNRIFFPLQYGVGLARFRLPRVFSPFTRPPDLVGHSGLSGAFAFLDRESGVYLAGTVNNVAKPGRPFRMMMRLLRAV